MGVVNQAIKDSVGRAVVSPICSCHFDTGSCEVRIIERVCPLMVLPFPVVPYIKSKYWGPILTTKERYVVSPIQGWLMGVWIPTAYAAGYFLWPLRGLAADEWASQEHPFLWVLHSKHCLCGDLDRVCVAVDRFRGDCFLLVRPRC